MKHSRLKKELRQVGVGKGEAAKLADLASGYRKVKPGTFNREAKRRIAPTPSAARPRLSASWALASLAAVCLLVVIGTVFLPKYLSNKPVGSKPFTNTDQEHESAEATDTEEVQQLPDKLALAEPLPTAGETVAAAPAPATEQVSPAVNDSGFRDNLYRQIYPVPDLYRSLPSLSKPLDLLF